MSDLIQFLQRAVQTRSYSDQEGDMAHLLVEEMKKLGFDQAEIDATGNVVGRMGSGPKIIHFDGHMDTVQVNDGPEWQQPPFSGQIVDGQLWGRGSVDMKGGLCAAVYAAADARDRGLLEGKAVYVTGTVCEEYCDGVNLKLLYADRGLHPDFCVICEPSGNVITLGPQGQGPGAHHHPRRLCPRLCPGEGEKRRVRDGGDHRAGGGPESETLPPGRPPRDHRPVGHLLRQRVPERGAQPVLHLSGPPPGTGGGGADLFPPGPGGLDRPDLSHRHRWQPRPGPGLDSSTP